MIRLKCAHHHHVLSIFLCRGWYWVLLIASAVLSLVLWIALGVYVSMNGESYHDSTTAEMMCTINSMSLCKFYVFVSDFVEGADSGKWYQNNSLCSKRAGSNSVKNGLVIACFLFALLTLVEWVSCVIILRCGATPSSAAK